MTVPTGVVSFLLTDVEDSTRLWEVDREGMAASLALHDRLIRQSVEGHGGYVFSTAGDAFAVAFPTPGAAVDAALEIQAALAGSAWPGPEIRVRIGLHTGTADERDGDYFGPTVNRAARVMSAGHGGHVLVSTTTAQLLQARIGPAATLVDRGSHRLAGVTDEERIFEVVHPAAPAADRPLRTREFRPTNLEAPLSSFVGRSKELEDIARRLDSHRLVVLTGPGGTGKSRLAVEAGRRALPSHPDGVWLIELAALSESGRVMTAIGDVFGLRPGELTGIDDVVMRHLWPLHLLVVIDNCEHVLPDAAAAIRRILDGAPNVRVLATSRESLGVSGESRMGVPALGVPAARSTGTAESVELFVDRAAAAAADFVVEDGDLPVIERICRRVEGIPLAIELAAARLRTLSPQELADRLDDSFGILGGSSKSNVSRHRTLEATIDWSFALLSDDERRAFRTLSVFAGGFDLAAAESVLGSDDVVDGLDSLVDKSLVMSARTEFGVRFRMLEPIRQYALGKLQESDAFDSARSAHASHFVEWVAAAAPHTRGPDQLAWDRRLDVDYDNIRLALAALLASERLDDYLRICFDLFMYWVHSGMHVEAIATCLSALESAGSADLLRRVKVWFVVAVMGAELTSPAAIEHARAGLEDARLLDDPNAIGRMEMALGATIRHATNDPEYLEHLLVARDLLDEHPTPTWWETGWDRGMTDLLLGGYLPASDQRAAAHGEAAVTAFERLGDRAMLGAALVEGTGAHGFSSDRTVADLRRAIEIFDEVRSVHWQAHARLFLGIVLRYREEHEEAAIHLELGAEGLDDLGDVSCWANALRWLSHSETALGMTDRARRRVADVIARFSLLPMQEVALPRTLDAVVVTLLGAKTPVRAAVALGCAESVPFPVESAIPRASVLEELAESLEAALGTDEAVRLRAEGAALDPLQFLEQARGWLLE